MNILNPNIVLPMTLTLLLAGCNGDKLADEAETHQEAACACTTFECTTEHVAWFNRMSIAESDSIEKMSEEGQARYSTASSATAECQDALRE